MPCLGISSDTIRLALVPLFGTLLACSQPAGGESTDTDTDTDTNTGTEGDVPVACGKLEVRVGDTCEPVTVTGYSTEPFEFERAGWTLFGTLYRPEVEADDYQPPGAVILHGSGPQGRIGLVPGNVGIQYDPPIPAYGSLAEQLVLRGFAVLIYDKRSCFVENNPTECAQSATDYPGDPNSITLADFLEDGRAATRALHEALDQDVVIIGHSKGAMYVPLLGAEEPNVCGVVMLAGATLSLAELISGQYDAAADYIESMNPNDPLIPQLRMLADEALDVLTQIGAGTYPASAWQGASTQFWADWIAMQANLHTSLENLDLPLYAAFGEADLNVTPANFELMQTWISMGLPATITAKLYPDHTHIFVQLTDEPPGYTDAVSDVLVDDIAAWLNAGE
jgi:dienelactone hydrolase